jgi:hypothetical protein
LRYLLYNRVVLENDLELFCLALEMLRLLGELKPEFGDGKPASGLPVNQA